MKLQTKSQREKLLAVIESRRKTLEEAITGVVQGFSTAMFVWGDPGLGKSHLVTKILDALVGKLWYHHTAFSTPKALVNSLYAAPDSIHLFEDCEDMIKNQLSSSILRAACGAPNDRERLVTWEAHGEVLRFPFFGGIIIATNANLARQSGPMQGVASRFRPIRWEMNLNERIATIMHLADRPYIRNGVMVDAKEAKKVALRLCQLCCEEKAQFALDLRLFTEHAIPAFAQAKNMPGQNWEDLLLAKLTGSANTQQESQDARTLRLQLLAESIDQGGGTHEEKLKKWTEATGLGKSIYYRHLKKAKAGLPKAIGHSK